jgi:Zn-dependent peptidase ImmA (M78 family)
MKSFQISPNESAQKVLNTIWGERPFPIDPFVIATQLGIKVIETELPPEVSGAIIKNKGNDPIIVLSKSDSNNRKRFSCAHELGHYAYRTDALQEEYDYIDLRGKNASMGTEPEEVFANKFAASLLMPETEVKKLYDKRIPFFLMAQYFGVSGDAITLRLANLKMAMYA